MGVVGLDGIGFDEVVERKQGPELRIGGFGEGYVPGIEGSAPRGKLYLPDFLYVRTGVRNIYKEAIGTVVVDFGDVNLHGELRL